MSKQTAASLFIFSPSESNSAELYQALLGGISGYQQLGERLIQFAEQAYAFRRYGRLKEVGLVLANIPIKPYRAIGHYFLAVAANSKGKGDQGEARRLFEQVVDVAPDFYKVKSILSLGALAYNRGDFDSAGYFYRQTIKVGKLSTASIQAIQGVSILKAMEGSHEQALIDMESILPVAKFAPPHIYFDLLNSYAVELSEVGRKDEARNIIGYLLASPLASAYPEWHETAEELRPSRRSFVAAGLAHTNVLTLPEREASDAPAEQPGPARVFDLAKWKKQMARQNRDKKIEKEIGQMSAQEMLFKLLELITENRPGSAQMRALLDFALSLFLQPSECDPDGPAS
jgi:tetratricopeptide (TPR) repeat protein